MVGPSLSDEDRAVASRRLKFGFVGLVGCSGGLVALSAGAAPTQVAGAALVGLVLGWALLVYLRWVGREWRANR